MDMILENLAVDSDFEAAAFLAEKTDLSRTKIKDAMQKGAVWASSGGRPKRLRRATAQLRQGDSVSIYYSEKIIRIQPETPELIADAGDYSVWNKPSGLMSAGSKFGDHCAINRVVEKMLDRPTFLVHRLDRFVWGLMVLAHTKTTAANLSLQFQKRETRKTYRSIVLGHISESVTITEPIDGKEATSHVTPVDCMDDRCLVEVQIETGRKHQIRRHLAGIGHPIIGDHQYGEAASEGIQLASVALGFTNPQGSKANYELPEALHPKLPDQEAN